MHINNAVYLTDQGLKRSSNQDGLLFLKSVPMYAVSDGNGSDDVARRALITLKDQSVHLKSKNSAVMSNPTTSTRLAVGAFFEGAFDRANAVIHKHNEETHAQAAATLVAATICGPYAFIAHVGDSRAYLLRGGRLRCLTNDHTLAALQLRRGDISPEEFATSPFRSTLSQSLGMSRELEVDIAEVHLMPGDVLLLCTNGLHKHIGEPAIRACLGASELKSAARALIRAVHNEGAPDNTTVVLIEVDDEVAPSIPVEELDRAARQVFLFKHLRETHWLRIAPYLDERRVQTGEVICRTGEAASSFYMVASGRVLLQQNAIERREIGASGHFGALTLVSDAPQLDTATALEPTVIYTMTRERFDRLVAHNPSLGTRLALALLEALGDRLGVLTVRLAQIIEAVQGRLGSI